MVFSAISLIPILIFSLVVNSEVQLHENLVFANFSVVMIVSGLAFFVGLNQRRVDPKLWSLLYFSLAIYFLVTYSMVFYQEPGLALIPDSVDNIFYHKHAINLLDKGLIEGSAVFLKTNPYDDLFVVIYVYLAYLIVDEPFIVYLFNCLITFFALNYMRKISQFVFYLPEKSFLISSLIVTPLLLSFSMTHYKESLLVFFFMGFCYYLFKIGKSKSASNILMFFLFCSGLFLLRTILIPIFLLSFVIVEFDRSVRAVLKGRLTKRSFFMLLLAFLILFLIVDVVFTYVARFSFVLSSGESVKDVPIGGELGRLVSIVLSLFGPLSDFLSAKGSEIKGVVAPGVYLVVVFSSVFILSIFKFVFVKASYIQKVFMWFIIIHSFALGFIFRGFDPRFTVFQKPLVILFSMSAIIYFLNGTRVGNKVLALAALGSVTFIALIFSIYQVI